MTENEQVNPDDLIVQGLSTTPIDEVENNFDESMEDITNEQEQELSDEEKRAFLIQRIKDRNNNFHPVKHPTVTVGTHIETNSFGLKREVKDKVVLTSITINQFDDKYRKARSRKNKLARASRKASR